MMPMVKKIEDGIHDLKTKLRNAPSAKSGSNLSIDHLLCFGIIGIPDASQLLLYPDPDPRYDEVEAKVRELAQRLIELYLLKNTNADEVEDIQPLTFDFFEKTCQLYFPDLWNTPKMKLVKKNRGDDGVDTYYHVNLIDDDGMIHPVNGETDSTLYFQGLPVGVWEDKTFDSQLTNTAEVAQAFTQVHYTAGVISKRIEHQLGICSGILTSGLNWTLIIKSSVKGNIIHNRTRPISLIDTSQTPPVETNVDVVTRLVLFHLQVIQSNIQLLKTYFSNICSTVRIDEEDEDVAPEDDDDTKKRKNVNRSRGGGKGKGSGKQGGALQLQSSNSHLTLENIYKFNLSQPNFV
jgi:hypothetical protein